MRHQIPDLPSKSQTRLGYPNFPQFLIFDLLFNWIVLQHNTRRQSITSQAASIHSCSPRLCQQKAPPKTAFWITAWRRKKTTQATSHSPIIQFKPLLLLMKSYSLNLIPTMLGYTNKISNKWSNGH